MFSKIIENCIPSTNEHSEHDESGESACNVTNESFEAHEALKATKVKNYNKLMHDTKEVVEKLQSVEEVVLNLASCLQELITSNQKRMTRVNVW